MTPCNNNNRKLCLQIMSETHVPRPADIRTCPRIELSKPSLTPARLHLGRLHSPKPLILVLLSDDHARGTTKIFLFQKTKFFMTGVMIRLEVASTMPGLHRQQMCQSIHFEEKYRGGSTPPAMQRLRDAGSVLWAKYRRNGNPSILRKLHGPGNKVGQVWQNQSLKALSARLVWWKQKFICEH